MQLRVSQREKTQLKFSSARREREVPYNEHRTHVLLPGHMWLGQSNLPELAGARAVFGSLLLCDSLCWPAAFLPD